MSKIPFFGVSLPEAPILIPQHGYMRNASLVGDMFTYGP